MVNNDKLYWVDTDAGEDDAVAILWALNNDFNIVGFSTVAGNLAVESTVRNVCALLEYSKKDIPVYYGASYATIGGHIDASHIHGVNLGPIVIDKDYKAKDHVFNGLINFFENSDKKLNIITLGPLTNISTFLMHFPKYKERIECLYIMGGGSFGNMTAYGEFNIYADVEAAHFVFNQNMNIVLSDLDITDHYAYFTKEDIDSYLKGRSLDNWIEQLLNFRISKSALPHAARIYDVLPFMYVKYPDYFTTNEVYVDVQLSGKMRGFTAYDYEGMRITNYLFPEKDIKKVKRLLTIDKNIYIDTLLKTFLR